jgi:Zn-dependent peptidase ImmA (M78 family)
MARRLARELQRAIRLEPPVDMVKVVVAVTGRLPKFYCDPDFPDALAVISARRNKVLILANRLVTVKERINFSLAHETGHVVNGHLHDFSCDTLFRDVLTDRERWVLDREADAFAAELLMPEDVVRDLNLKHADRRRLWLAKNFFGVSWQALLIRLDELGILRRDERDEILP